MYSLDAANDTLSVHNKVYRDLLDQYRFNASSNQKEVLQAIAPGLGVLVIDTKMFQDPEVVDVIISLYNALLRSFLQIQKQEMFTKFTCFLTRTQRDIIGLQTEEMDKRFWAKLQNTVQTLRAFVADKDKPHRTWTKTSKKVQELRVFGENLIRIKSIIDIAHIVFGWKSEPGFRGYDIHITTLGQWHKAEWKFFDRIMDLLSNDQNYCVLKYNVHLLSPEGPEVDEAETVDTLFNQFKLKRIF